MANLNKRIKTEWKDLPEQQLYYEKARQQSRDHKRLMTAWKQL